MKRRKYMKFLSGLLCAAMLSVELPSVEFMAFAAEAESVQEMEAQTQENTDAQEEDFENVSSVFEKDTYAESSQIPSSQILEKTESQMPEETMSESAEASESEMESSVQWETISETAEITETELEDISETETPEMKTQVMLDADGNIASGTGEDSYYGDITWVINADGELTVTGTGDFSAPNASGYSRAPWYEYRGKITSAKINITEMKSASYMFYECSNMTSVEFYDFDTSNIIYMNDMFTGCSSLSSLVLSNFNTSNVTDMSSMFYGCSSLTILDLSNFNTSNVTSMGSMFYGCSSLTSLNLSSFNVNVKPCAYP